MSNTNTESRLAWLEAFAEFQADMPNIDNGGVGTTAFGEYRYARLPDMMASLIPVLSKHGFSVRWEGYAPDIEPPAVGVRCVLAHRDGHEERSSIEAKIEPDPTGKTPLIHRLGAAHTYLRRYSLQAVCGICTEVDLDGADKTANGSVRASASRARSNSKSKSKPQNGNPNKTSNPEPPAAELELPTDDESESPANSKSAPAPGQRTAEQWTTVAREAVDRGATRTEKVEIVEAAKKDGFGWDPVTESFQPLEFL